MSNKHFSFNKVSWIKSLHGPFFIHVLSGTEKPCFLSKSKFLGKTLLANFFKKILFWFFDTFNELWILPKAKSISDKRRANAQYLDDGLNQIKQITLPPRPKDFRLVFHLYIVFAVDRDRLLKFCLDKGISAKIHYPIPIYKQTALEHLGYQDGDFPVTDEHVKKIITFPCDQHLEKNQLDYIISTVAKYYE